MSPRDVATYVAKAKADPRPPSCARPAKSSASRVARRRTTNPRWTWTSGCARSRTSSSLASTASPTRTGLRAAATAHARCSYRLPARVSCRRQRLLISICEAITGRDQRQSAPIVDEQHARGGRRCCAGQCAACRRSQRFRSGVARRASEASRRFSGVGRGARRRRRRALTDGTDRFVRRHPDTERCSWMGATAS